MTHFMFWDMITIGSAGLGFIVLLGVFISLYIGLAFKNILSTLRYTISFLVIGIVLIIPVFLFARSCENSRNNAEILITEYPIQKLTRNKVHFNDEFVSLNNKNTYEKKVILEEPNNEHQNVVIEEAELFSMQWLRKINVKRITYHVYLSEDNFNKYNGIIYCNMEGE